MFEYGEIVQVKTFTDGIVELRVTGGNKGTVFLCNEFEFQSAQKEKREPISIGFPIEDIVTDQENKKAA
jgi:hypothetical protein